MNIFACFEATFPDELNGFYKLYKNIIDIVK